MEIEINGNAYEVPDCCPTNPPKRSSLKRHLDQHGAESFLASKKYGQYAPCILNILEDQGAEIAGTNQDLEQPAQGPQVPSSSVPTGSVRATPSPEGSGDIRGSLTDSCCEGEHPRIGTAQEEKPQGESPGDSLPANKDGSSFRSRTG